MIVARIFNRTVQLKGGRLAVFAEVGEASIYDVIARHRAELLRGETKAARKMVNAYKIAQAEITKRLRAVEAKLKAAEAAGIDISPAWFYQREEWTQLLAETLVQVDRYSAVAYAQSVEMQDAAANMANRHATALIKSSGVSGGFIMLPTEAITDMVGALDNGSPLIDLFKKMGTDAVADFRRTMVAGFAAGDNPRKIARDLRRLVPLPKKRAVLIARTESLRVYRTAQARNFKANSDVVVAQRIVSSRDARTCFLCIARDGTILEPGEIFGSHPGCRCTLQPVVKYLDRPRIDGEAWLRTQGEDVQREKLGASRFAMWKDGRATLADMTNITNSAKWGQGVKPRTLVELGQAERSNALGKRFNTTPPEIARLITGKNDGQ